MCLTKDADLHKTPSLKHFNTIYRDGFHQTLDFQLIQNRRDRPDDDLHRDIVNLLHVARVNRPVVSRCAGLSGHYRGLSTG